MAAARNSLPVGWNFARYHAGNKSEWGGIYRRSPLSPFFPFVDLFADYAEGGVIAYWLEFNTTLPVLIPELNKQVKMVPNKKLIRKPGFNPQPGYAYYESNEVSDVLVWEPADCAAFVFLNTFDKVYKITHNPIDIEIPDDVIPIPNKHQLFFVNYGKGLVYILQGWEWLPMVFGY